MRAGNATALVELCLHLQGQVDSLSGAVAKLSGAAAQGGAGGGAAAGVAAAAQPPMPSPVPALLRMGGAGGSELMADT